MDTDLKLGKIDNPRPKRTGEWIKAFGNEWQKTPQYLDLLKVEEKNARTKFSMPARYVFLAEQIVTAQGNFGENMNEHAARVRPPCAINHLAGGTEGRTKGRDKSGDRAAALSCGDLVVVARLERAVEINPESAIVARASIQHSGTDASALPHRPRPQSPECAGVPVVRIQT